MNIGKGNKTKSLQMKKDWSGKVTVKFGVCAVLHVIMVLFSDTLFCKNHNPDAQARYDIRVPIDFLAQIFLGTHLSSHPKVMD